MTPLFIKEDEVKALAPIADVIDALEQAFRQQATGQAFNNSRSRLRMSGTTLHMMAASIPGYFGYKAYTSAPAGARFMFYLFKTETTELVSIMEADALGQIRTGAATGLATKVMSNSDITEATLFGAGWQAETQLQAMDAVRNLKRVWIVNRKPERRDAFIKKMQPLVRSELLPAESAEKAVRSSRIVTTMTSSREPVVKGEWLESGTHINAAGGNMLLRREVDDETLIRSHRIVVDSIDQARIEAGEFVSPIETGRRHWEDFVELRDVVSGAKPGRTSSAEITFFKSLGLALEDVAIGKLVYERAIAQSAGRRVNL